MGFVAIIAPLERTNTNPVLFRHASDALSSALPNCRHVAAHAQFSARRRNLHVPTSSEWQGQECINTKGLRRLSAAKVLTLHRGSRPVITKASFSSNCGTKPTKYSPQSDTLSVIPSPAPGWLKLTRSCFIPILTHTHSRTHTYLCS